LGVYWHAETQARRHPRAQRAEQAAVVGRLHQECEARPRDRVVVYWNTLQRGLAMAVQPSGHRAWKCVYTIRRQADALVAKYLLRGWAKLDIGSIRRADVKAAIAAIAAPVTPAWRRAAVTYGQALN
jgi:hypothetical protein